jgi:hypothetical protein
MSENCNHSKIFLIFPSVCICAAGKNFGKLFEGREKESEMFIPDPQIFFPSRILGSKKASDLDPQH